MILVLCLDETGGMAFNQRRQSRDRLLIADLAELARGSAIHLHPRSAMLFEDSEARVIPSPDFTKNAKEGEYCFLEFSAPAPLESKTEKLIIYRWNRRYQADLFFDIELKDWLIESASDFPGTSHEKITREVYIRE